MIRYGFNIRTRTGQRVDNISIMAGSQTDAERRLRQTEGIEAVRVGVAVIEHEARVAACNRTHLLMTMTDDDGDALRPRVSDRIKLV